MKHQYTITFARLNRVSCLAWMAMLCSSAPADEPASPPPPANTAAEATLTVQPVPAGLAIRYGIDRSFYKKYADAGGIPVLSSAKVRDAALLEVKHLILKLLAGRDDVREALAKKKVRVGIMAYDEFTTSMPETRGIRRSVTTRS